MARRLFMGTFIGWTGCGAETRRAFFMYGSGSRCWLFCRIEKWRCEPVARPLLETDRLAQGANGHAELAGQVALVGQHRSGRHGAGLDGCQQAARDDAVQRHADALVHDGLERRKWAGSGHDRDPAAGQRRP